MQSMAAASFFFSPQNVEDPRAKMAEGEITDKRKCS